MGRNSANNTEHFEKKERTLVDWLWKNISNTAQNMKIGCEIDGGVGVEERM